MYQSVSTAWNTCLCAWRVKKTMHPPPPRPGATASTMLAAGAAAAAVAAAVEVVEGVEAAAASGNERSCWLFRMSAVNEMESS